MTRGIFARISFQHFPVKYAHGFPNDSNNENGVLVPAADAGAHSAKIICIKSLEMSDQNRHFRSVTKLKTGVCINSGSVECGEKIVKLISREWTLGLSPVEIKIQSLATYTWRYTFR